MAFIPAPNTALVELRYLQDNQNVENTLWFENAAGWTEATLVALGLAIREWWVDNLQGGIGQDVTLREIYVTDQTSATGLSATITSGLPLPGTASTDATTNSNTLCVSFRTAQRGRSYRGRNYVVGLPINALDQNTVTAGYRNFVQAAYAALLTVAADQNSQWVVVSKQLNNVPRTVAARTPVTAVAVVDSTVDSQRRRLPGRGK